MHERLAQPGELGDLLPSRVRGRDEVDQRRVFRPGGGALRVGGLSAGRPVTAVFGRAPVRGRLVRGRLPAAAAKPVLRKQRRRTTSKNALRAVVTGKI